MRPLLLQLGTGIKKIVRSNENLTQFLSKNKYTQIYKLDKYNKKEITDQHF